MLTETPINISLRLNMALFNPSYPVLFVAILGSTFSNACNRGDAFASPHLCLLVAGESHAIPAF